MEIAIFFHSKWKQREIAVHKELSVKRNYQTKRAEKVKQLEADLASK